MPSVYTRDSIVEVWPFSRQRDGDDVIIGRTDIGVFVAVPPEAVEVLDYLAQGKNLGEAADLHQQKYGTVPDLNDFLQLLESSGLIRTNHTAGSRGPAEKHFQAQRYHFQSISESLAQRIFNPTVITVCCLLVAAAIGLMVYIPALVPRPSEMYFTEHRTLTILFVFLFAYVSVVTHEMAHLVAARARGVSSRIGFGYRLWILVAEADLTGLWSIPRRQRYLPLFAGSLHDAVMASLCVFVLFAQHENWLAFPDFGVRLLRLSLLILMARVVWQCLVFVRTDYYYVISTFLNCRNLLTDTENFLRNQLARMIPWIRLVDQSDVLPAERRMLFPFAILWLAGRIAALAFFITIVIPVLASYAANFVHVLKVGYSVDPYNFIDTVMVSITGAVPLTIGISLWIASLIRYAKHKHENPHPVEIPAPSERTH